MAVAFQDYYETLGLDRNATEEDVHRAYRKLARQYHPDINKAPDASEKFKQINEAYEVLRDPEKRSRYDQLGPNWRAGEPFTPPPGAENVDVRFGGFGDLGGSDFSDFFKAFFGEMGGFRRGGFRQGGVDFGTGPRATAQDWPPQGNRPRKGSDEEAEIEITLEEAARGAKKSVELEKMIPGGNGQLRPERSSYGVSIPPGVTDGSRIRLGGQGGRGLGGGASGDLFLRVRLRPDPRFRVEDHDLRTRIDVAPWEAALGARVDVPTLTGTVTMRVPPGTPSGQTLRLRGKGLPRRKGAAGDLLAEVRIVVPKTLSDRERELFEQLARDSQFRPREIG